MDNLFRDLARDSAGEQFDALVDSGDVLIERIVSLGHTGPEDGWYDQERSEWVLLLRGAARLVFEDGREIALEPGDWLDIPARCRHRVAWTDPDVPTVWLAVHYPP
ncbi:MAG: cupin domain-containing protein [Xanthomonadales bacterium]|nr:cupin domain-containing protein [Xanthomonadales bacterium]